MKNSFFLALGVLLSTSFPFYVFSQARSVIRFEFGTRSDDLRGNGENVSISIDFVGSGIGLRGLPSRADFPNINNNKKWEKNSINRVELTLPGAYKPENIREVRIQKTRTSIYPAIDGDNWDTTIKALLEYDGLNGTMIVTRLNGITSHVFRLEEHTVRLSERGLLNEPRSGDEGIVRFNIARNTTPSNLVAFFKTGGDDLRGDNDNINLEIVHRNTMHASPYRITNINAKRKWNNNFEKTVIIPIPKEFNPEDITEIRIIHTGGGGFDADNWDLSKFSLKVNIEGREYTLVNIVDVALVHRFTGDSRQFSKRL
jgi:hypothetical protein